MTQCKLIQYGTRQLLITKFTSRPAGWVPRGELGLTSFETEVADSSYQEALTEAVPVQVPLGGAAAGTWPDWSPDRREEPELMLTSMYADSRAMHPDVGHYHAHSNDKILLSGTLPQPTDIRVTCIDDSGKIVNTEEHKQATIYTIIPFRFAADWYKVSHILTHDNDNELMRFVTIHHLSRFEALDSGCSPRARAAAAVDTKKINKWIRDTGASNHMIARHKVNALNIYISKKSIRIWND